MTAPQIRLSERETRAYRLGQALVQAAEGRREGLAFEVSDELAKSYPSEFRRQGELFVPYDLLTTRAGLDTATATKGQELKFQQPLPWIDLLRAETQVAALGATVLPGLVGDVKIPRLTGASTATMVAQNPGSNLADSNALLDHVSLTPKTIQDTTSYSRQLLQQSYASSAVDALVLADIARAHGVLIDKQAIQGSGAGNDATGLTVMSGTGAVVGGANGAQTTWANMVDLEAAVSGANVPTDPQACAYLTTPTIRQSLRKKDRGGTSTGWFVLADDSGGAVAAGYRVAVSANVPSNLTKGTSNGICHAIIYGRWSELLIGLWGALQIVVDPYTLKKQGMIEVTSFNLFDVQARHAAAFAVMKDALP